MCDECMYSLSALMLSIYSSSLAHRERQAGWRRDEARRGQSMDDGSSSWRAAWMNGCIRGVIAVAGVSLSKRMMVMMSESRLE